MFVRTVDGENGNKMYAGFVRGLRQIYGQVVKYKAYGFDIKNDNFRFRFRSVKYAKHYV